MPPRKRASAEDGKQEGANWLKLEMRDWRGDKHHDKKRKLRLEFVLRLCLLRDLIAIVASYAEFLFSSRFYVPVSEVDLSVGAEIDLRGSDESMECNGKWCQGTVLKRTAANGRWAVLVKCEDHELYELPRLVDVQPGVENCLQPRGHVTESKWSENRDFKTGDKVWVWDRCGKRPQWIEGVVHPQHWLPGRQWLVQIKKRSKFDVTVFCAGEIYAKHDPARPSNPSPTEAALNPLR